MLELLGELFIDLLAFFRPRIVLCLTIIGIIGLIIWLLL